MHSIYFCFQVLMVCNISIALTSICWAYTGILRNLSRTSCSRRPPSPPPPRWCTRPSGSSTGTCSAWNNVFWLKSKQEFSGSLTGGFLYLISTQSFIYYYARVCQNNTMHSSRPLIIWSLDSREEELQDLPDHAVAQQRRLVSLADGAEQAALAIKTKVEQKVLRVLEKKILD